jgi:hypothetical protein
MPWQGVCPMQLRMRFVNVVLADEDSMIALCDEYGVSRNPVADNGLLEDGGELPTRPTALGSH